MAWRHVAHLVGDFPTSTTPYNQTNLNNTINQMHQGQPRKYLMSTIRMIPQHFNHQANIHLIVSGSWLMVPQPNTSGLMNAIIIQFPHLPVCANFHSPHHYKNTQVPPRSIHLVCLQRPSINHLLHTDVAHMACWIIIPSFHLSLSLADIVNPSSTPSQMHVRLFRCTIRPQPTFASDRSPRNLNPLFFHTKSFLSIIC